MTTKNTKIINPKTGNLEFGFLHEIVKPTQKIRIEPGNIYLRFGEHIGKNHGFGMRHIWIEHRSELIRLKYLTEDDVPRFVSDIIVPGAIIHVEDVKRPTILRSSKGIAILELKRVGEVFEYSVVTAYTRKTAYGSIVGSIQRQ